MTKKDEIRTPRNGVLVATKTIVAGKPVAIIKNGKKIDTLSIEEFAQALYGEDVQCFLTRKRKKITGRTHTSENHSL